MRSLTDSVLADLDPAEVALLQERVAEAEAGDLISGDLVEEWVSSWFTSGELPPPVPGGEG